MSCCLLVGFHHLITPRGGYCRTKSSIYSARVPRVICVGPGRGLELGMPVYAGGFDECRWEGHSIPRDVAETRIAASAPTHPTSPGAYSTSSATPFKPTMEARKEDDDDEWCITRSVSTLLDTDPSCMC